MSRAWAKPGPGTVRSLALAFRPAQPLALALGAIAVGGAALAPPARAQGPEWRLAQPLPPRLATEAQGGEGCAGGEESSCPQIPIGLGRIGDIEFWSSNRGLLITAGNGSTIPAGVWDYNGEGWHELADVCGATDGRIAWAGSQEFWTVSDGRPGQAANPQGALPPLEDNTLCRFAVNQSGQLEVVNSYAAPAFSASSYQPMQAAACRGPANCWFAGAPLPAPQPGAFQLHWNGGSLEAEPNTAAHSIADIRAFAGGLYESIGLAAEEPQGAQEEPIEILHPYILDKIVPEAAGTIFAGLRPYSPEQGPLPEYASGSYPQALAPLHLAAGEGDLWAAAGPTLTPPGESSAGELTVLLDSGGSWSQVLGPESPLTVRTDPASLEGEAVSSIAAEPGTSSAWLALDSQLDLNHPNPTELADVAHVQADGEVTEEQLPSVGERARGIGPKGAAYEIACPAQNDCWLATTQGWLFHLSEAADETLPRDGDGAFNGPLISYRPPDHGLPQVQSNALPIDDSGEDETRPPAPPKAAASPSASVNVPLLSDLHSRLLHKTTLELSFHLAARARVRLIAKRHARVVASTPTRTLVAGSRSLTLRLDPRRWPTKLDLETHALAPLPTITGLGGVNTLTTSLAFPAAAGLLSAGGLSPAGGRAAASRRSTGAALTNGIALGRSGRAF